MMIRLNLISHIAELISEEFFLYFHKNQSRLFSRIIFHADHDSGFRFAEKVWTDVLVKCPSSRSVLIILSSVTISKKLFFLHFHELKYKSSN